MKAPLFYSKILLFGEYGIIKNSKGLSIPYNFFKGGLKIGNFKNESEKASNKSLTDFKNYLKTIESSVLNLILLNLTLILKMACFSTARFLKAMGLEVVVL